MNILKMGMQFKRELVRLLANGELSVAELQREIGVRPDQIHKWKAQFANGDVAAISGFRVCRKRSNH